VLVWLGSLGFLDDYLKVVRRRTEGLVGKYKLIGQAVLGLLVGLFMLSIR
jgi:phospho-N-acetylmuramoyl-pentapeptide-transferase